MRTAILITARLGSSRLPCKHLQPCAGQPAMKWLIDRICREFAEEIRTGQAIVAIATTEEPENQAFQDVAPSSAVVFCGSKENIPLRHLQAAKALGCEAIVSVDGDDILCAREGMRAVYSLLQDGARLAKTDGLPFGMNVWGYSTAALERSLERHTRDVLETGWGRIFDLTDCAVASYTVAGNSDMLRFTLDYAEDLALFDAVISELGESALDADAHTIVRCVVDNGLQAITQDRVREYWENFYQQQAHDIEQGGVDA